MIRACTSCLERLNIQNFVRGFSRRTHKQYADLFAVCLDLSHILRIEIFIRDPLRARKIVDQDFQGGKLIVIKSAMITVYRGSTKTSMNREKGEDLLGSHGFFDSNFGGLHPFNVVVRPRYHPFV